MAVDPQHRRKPAPTRVACPIVRRMTVRLDETTDAALQRHAAPGEEAAYMRAAVIEKAARDEHRADLDELRRRVEALERRLKAL